MRCDSATLSCDSKALSGPCRFCRYAALNKRSRSVTCAPRSPESTCFFEFRRCRLLCSTVMRCCVVANARAEAPTRSSTVRRSLAALPRLESSLRRSAATALSSLRLAASCFSNALASAGVFLAACAKASPPPTSRATIRPTAAMRFMPASSRRSFQRAWERRADRARWERHRAVRPRSATWPRADRHRPRAQALRYAPYAAGP